MSAPLRNLISSTSRFPAIQSTSPIIPSFSFQLHPQHDLVANPPVPSIPSFLALMVSPPFPINARICTPSMRMILKRAGSIPSQVGSKTGENAGRFLILKSRKALLKGMEMPNFLVILCQKFIERKKGTYLRYISSCIYTYEQIYYH